MSNLVFYLVLAALVAFASASKYTDCGSSTGTVSAVYVSNCTDDQDQCILTKGTKANITIVFASKAASKTLTAVVHGIIAGVPIPFPLPEPDACKTGVDCPVKNGQDCTYSNNLSIRKSYPPLSVTVKYELKDDNSGDMVCIEIPCKIE